MGLFRKPAAVRSGLAGAGVLAALVTTGVALAAGQAPPIKLKTLKTASGALNVPYASVLSTNGKTLYVADLSNGVEALSLAHPSAKPVQVTDGGKPLTNAVGLALAPNGKTLYATAELANKYGVFMIDVSGSKTDASNDTVVGKIFDPTAIIQEPTGLAVSRNGKLLYIGDVPAGSGLTPTGTLVVARLTSATKGYVASDETESGLKLGEAMTWSHNDKMLYVANLGKPAVILKVSGQTVTSAGELSGTSGIFAFALSADGRTLYGTTLVPPTTSGGTFTSALDTFSFLDRGRQVSFARPALPSPSAELVGITLSSNGRTGYVTAVVPPSAGRLSSFAIPAAATKVTISGHVRVGAVLTATVKGASGASDSYRWFANAKAIKGATKRTLKPGPSLTGKKLTVKATVGAVGYSEASVTSKATGKVAA
jgi:hypothetical protein